MNSRTVTDWMDETGTTRKDLAGALGINLSTLWRLLNAKEFSKRSALAFTQVIEKHPDGINPRPKSQFRQAKCLWCGGHKMTAA